jgi:hypothetical protein
MVANKSDLPSALEELDQPRPRTDLRALRSRQGIPDRTIEQNSRSMGEQWRASTQLPESRSVPIAKLRVDIPDYVFQQMRRRSFEEGGTQSYLILKGLAAIGFEIHEDDLVLDKRKKR